MPDRKFHDRRNFDRKLSTSGLSTNSSENQRINSKFQSWSDFSETCFIERKTVRLSCVNFRWDTFKEVRDQNAPNKKLEICSKKNPDVSSVMFGLEGDEIHSFELIPFNKKNSKSVKFFSEMKDWHDLELPHHNKLAVDDIGKKMTVSIYNRGFAETNNMFVLVHQIFNENIREISFSREHSVICQVLCDDVKMGYFKKVWSQEQTNTRNENIAPGQNYEFTEHLFSRYIVYQVISFETGPIWLFSDKDNPLKTNQFVNVYIPPWFRHDKTSFPIYYPIEAVARSDINLNANVMFITVINKNTALIRNATNSLEINNFEFGLSLSDIGAEVLIENDEVIDVKRPRNLQEFADNFRKAGLSMRIIQKRVVECKNGVLKFQNSDRQDYSRGHNHQNNHRNTHRKNTTEFKSYKIIRNFDSCDVIYDTVVNCCLVDDGVYLELKRNSKLKYPEDETSYETDVKKESVSVEDKSKMEVFRVNSKLFQALQNKFINKQKSKNLHFKTHQKFKHCNSSVADAINGVMNEFSVMEIKYSN